MDLGAYYIRVVRFEFFLLKVEAQNITNFEYCKNPKPKILSKLETNQSFDQFFPKLKTNSKLESLTSQAKRGRGSQSKARIFFEQIA